MRVDVFVGQEVRITTEDLSNLAEIAELAVRPMPRSELENVDFPVNPKISFSLSDRHALIADGEVESWLTDAAEDEAVLVQLAGESADGRSIVRLARQISEVGRDLVIFVESP